MTTATVAEGSGQTSQQPGGEQGDPPTPPSGEDNPPAPPTQSTLGDVNGDSSITIADLTLLKQYLAGWNVKLGGQQEQQQNNA